MMEEMRQSSFEEKVITTPETGLELPKHLDVSEVMKDKNAFFIHMIQVTDQFDVSVTNKSINTNKLSVSQKLDLVYGLSPTLSASTVRPHTNDETFNGGFGVIFSHGEIAHAHQGDAATRAVSLTERDVLTGVKKEKQDVDNAIEKETASYNEFVLKNQEVAGGFMKLGTFKDRITYEEEEVLHYNGENEVTKIGIIDLSNPLDKIGRPTGVNYDKPLSVLVEMQKRGKVFVMDESNQMYIVRNIDEARRRVEFTAAPIDPNVFAKSYGAEPMNKYHKKEIADRFRESLGNKK